MKKLLFIIVLFQAINVKAQNEKQQQTDDFKANISSKKAQPIPPIKLKFLQDNIKKLDIYSTQTKILEGDKTSEKIIQRSGAKLRGFTKNIPVDVTGQSAQSSALSNISAITTIDGAELTGNVSWVSKNNPNNIWNLSVNTPFEGKKKQAINLDGLAKKTSLSLGFYHEFWTTDKAEAIIGKLDLEEVTAVLDQIGEERECDCGKEPERHPIYTELTNKEKAKLQKLLEYKMNVIFFGLRAKIARGDYDYFTDSTLTGTSSDTKYDAEGRAFAGLRITNHRAIALTFIYQNYYDAGDAANYNRPLVNNVEKQEELYYAAPEHLTKKQVQFEYRSVNKSNTFGLNPYVLIDLSTKQAEIRSQFYFFRNKDEDGNIKGLNGGVYFGYRTASDFDFTLEKANVLVGLFFSGVFDVNKY